MRVAMSPSRARAVARNATEVPAWRACSSAWRLLPLRAPPRTRRECGATVTRVLPRRPVRGGGVGQVSWLSDRPTPRPFPIRLVPDQWPIAGFVPDYSDGVAADSHRLPWGPHLAGRPDTKDGPDRSRATGQAQGEARRRAGLPAGEAIDMPPLARGGPAGPGRTIGRRRRPGFAWWGRRGEILVQQRGLAAAAAPLRQDRHPDDPAHARKRHLDEVPRSHRLGWLRGVAVDVHLASGARGGSEGATLEEAGRPP